MAKSTRSKSDSNLHGALAYLLGPITGVIFLILDNDDKFVKYHALQSIVFFILMWILTAIAAILKLVLIGFILIPLLSLISFVAWLYSMYKAYKGEMHELPIVGRFVKTL